MKLNFTFLLFIFGLVSFLSSCVGEGDLPPNTENSFIRFKGSADYGLEAVDAVLLDNGNILLLANAIDISQDPISYYPAVYIIDQNANPLETFILDTNPQRSYDLSIIDQDTYLISGEHLGELSLVKVTSSGSATQYSSSLAARARASTTNEFGDILVIAEKNSGSSLIKPVVIKTDEEFTDLQITNLDADKQLVVSNIYETSYNEDSVFVYWSAINSVKQNSEISRAQVGQIIEKSPSFPANEADFIAASIFREKEDEFAVVGNTGSTMTFVYQKVQNNIENFSYAVIRSNTTATSVGKTASGYFIIGGINFSETNNGETDYYFALVDAKGNKVQERIYGGENSDDLQAVLGLPDGKIFLFGTTEFGDVKTLLLMKTDEKGDL